MPEESTKKDDMPEESTKKNDSSEESVEKNDRHWIEDINQKNKSA